MLGAVQPAGGADVEALLNARVQAEYAFYTGDTRHLVNVERELQGMASHASDTMLAYYYAGYVDFRLAQLRLEQDKSESALYSDACIENLDKAIKAEKEFADAYALQSACYGLKAAAQPVKAVYLSVRASRKISKARELDPDNPRVSLLDGMNDYYLPGLFGGDKESALEKLTRAVKLFNKAESPQYGYPDWGLADLYAMVGDIHLERKEAVRARDAFEQALMLAPDYEKVQKRLAETLAMLRGG